MGAPRSRHSGASSPSSWRSACSRCSRWSGSPSTPATLILNKSRLQNTVDAAALAAAKVLDQTGSEAQADGRGALRLRPTPPAIPSSTRVMSGADITLQYLEHTRALGDGHVPANYVRVVADDFTMWTSFTSLVGITEYAHRRLRGRRARAHPWALTDGNEACNLVPMMVCADMSAGAAGDWGYTGNDVTLAQDRFEPPGSDRTGQFPALPARRLGRQRRPPEPGGRVRPVHRSGRHDHNQARQQHRADGPGTEHALWPVPGRWNELHAHSRRTL